MLQYTIKRLLIMIPTFFVVSVVIFLILNLAPGRPGQAGDQGISKTAESVGARESYRIFKEQFNLDKPILLNTRFALEQSEVRELLVVGYNLAGKPSAAERIELLYGRFDDGHGRTYVLMLGVCVHVVLANKWVSA